MQVTFNLKNTIFKIIKKNWIKYTTYTGLECAYCFNEDLKEYITKVISKIPKRFYYSALNESGLHFEEIILPKL